MMENNMDQYNKMTAATAFNFLASNENNSPNLHLAEDPNTSCIQSILYKCDLILKRIEQRRKS